MSEKVPKARFRPSGHSFPVAVAETVLQAGLERGFRIPHACDNGVCHICRAKLLSGGLASDAGAWIRRQGDAEVLLCRARIEQDTEFEIDALWGPNELETKEIALQVKSVEGLSADIYRVECLAPAGRLPEFFAGQYLQLLVPGYESAFFSIANAPGSRRIELHIQVHPDQLSARAILDYMRNEGVVRARLPMGKCCLETIPDADVVLVAAGTGFAQMKSITEYLLEHDYLGQITLYWGVRTPEEMYLRDWAEAWADKYPELTFVPVSADNQDNEWQGHHAELVREVLARKHKWLRSLVFVSGSPTMVYTALDAFAPMGLPENQFYSDVLEYAPRG